MTHSCAGMGELSSYSKMLVIWRFRRVFRLYFRLTGHEYCNTAVFAVYPIPVQRSLIKNSPF